MESERSCRQSCFRPTVSGLLYVTASSHRLHCRSLPRCRTRIFCDCQTATQLLHLHALDGLSHLLLGNLAGSETPLAVIRARLRCGRSALQSARGLSFSTRHLAQSGHRGWRYPSDFTGVPSQLPQRRIVLSPYQLCVLASLRPCVEFRLNRYGLPALVRRVLRVSGSSRKSHCTSAPVPPAPLQPVRHGKIERMRLKTAHFPTCPRK